MDLLTARRRPERAGRSAWLRALLVLATAALAAACAGRGSDGGGAGGAGAGDEADEIGGEAARRAASQRMVERGREALAAGRLELAASRVERAVRVDPSNGRAYLALAEVRIAQGRPGDARGLLERALGLLPADSPAGARADSLLRAGIAAPPD